jgi:tetratricopeptide (TPR) repeat protein
MPGRRNFWNRREELLDTSDELALKADLLAYESKYEEAVEYYTRALEICPANPHLWAFKGITLKGGLGREQEALECWDKAMKLDPELAQAANYADKKDHPDEIPEGPVTCPMSPTTRQKILQKMREQGHLSGNDSGT